MYDQIDLKVASEISKTKDRTINFHEFSSVKLHCKK
jgi:hypothetical protein